MREIPLPDRLTSLAVRFKSPFRGHGIREDGSDAESVRRVAALNPPGLSTCILHAPARYSRRGPVFALASSLSPRMLEAAARQDRHSVSTMRNCPHRDVKGGNRAMGAGFGL